MVQIIYIINKSGEGTHETIMGNVRYFQEKGYNPWAICVISEHNISHPDEIYSFFKSEGFRVRFCPEIEQRGFTSEDYFNFIKEVYVRWEQDGRILNVSNFNKILRSIETGVPQECDNMKNCLENNLCIDTTGDVYPCNRFVGMDDFVLGNIEEGLETIVNSKRTKELSERSKYLTCNCDEVRLLFGGCMYNSQMRTGDWREVDPYCATTRRLIKLLRGKNEGISS